MSSGLACSQDGQLLLLFANFWYLGTLKVKKFPPGPPMVGPRAGTVYERMFNAVDIL